MYSEFGLYISAVGIALVFTSLSTIWLMIEVTKRLFSDRKAPTEKDMSLANVAAISAVLMCTKGERIYQVSKVERTGQWRTAAKIEVLDRGMNKER